MAFRAFRSQGYVGVAKQTVQGTPVAPTKFVKYRRAGYDPTQDVDYLRNPNGRDHTYGVKKSHRWAGSWETPLFPDEGGLLLALAMGKDTISGAADPWTHTITLLDSIPYFTTEVGRGEDLSSADISGRIDRVQDCKVNGITVAGTAAELVVLTVDVAGIKSALSATPATVTYDDAVSEGPMMFHQGVFTITGPGNATQMNSQIQKFMMRMRQNIDYVMANSFVSIGLVEQAREFDLTFDAVFDGPMLYAWTYNGTPEYSGTATSATPTTLVDTGATFATIANTHAIRITGGLGVGQIRAITANTGTSVTVAAWTTTPDVTSTYEIFPIAPSSVFSTGAFDVKFTSAANPEHSIDLNMAAIYFEQVKSEISPENNTMVMSCTAKPRRSGATMPLAVVAKANVNTAFV